MDEIIDNAETRNGYPFATLEHVLAFKKKLKREKDLYHIQLIESYLNKRKIVATE